MSRGTTQTGIGTLRTVLAAAAGVLVLVLIAFNALAHLRVQNFLAGLTGAERRLGIDVQQESNGFTFSKSSKGRTIYTIHASKEVQRKDGRIALHDVGITLFGPTGQPADRIHGADFEYDQKAQVMTATGEVFLDLQPPASARPVGKPEDLEARVIHVKTIGLVFRQRDQIASSDGAVAFRTGGYAGSSEGATYDAEAGDVVLESAVRISGLRAERPVLLTAARAELKRAASTIDLTEAKYTSAGESGSESVAARRALVHIKPDGTPEQIDGDGGVLVASAQHGELRSRAMEVKLGPAGQARDAHFLEDVRFTNENGSRRDSGQADDLRIGFDDAGRARHSIFSAAAGKGVHLAEQTPASLHQLDGGRVELDLSGGGREPSVIRNAVAYGPAGARLRLTDDGPQGRRSTDLTADRLNGRFAPGTVTTELAGLDGTGHTRLDRLAQDPTGTMLARDQSTGETVRLDFMPGTRAGDAKSNRSILTRAEQRGDVESVHETAAKAGSNEAPEVERARADDAVFEAQANLVHLTGAVQLQDASSALFADRVDLNRDTGDAAANGSVRVTYPAPSAPESNRAQSPQDPVHVTAMRAVAHKSSGLAEFFGAAGVRARMWQGGSQVEAPVLDFYRSKNNDKRLVAHGEPGSDAAFVHTVLVQEQQPAKSPARSDTGHSGSDRPIRVVSRELVYTDSARTAVFTGSVRAVSGDGTIAAKEATVWLVQPGAESVKQGAAKTAETGQGFPAGRVDHMVATGDVVLTQPGRVGTGAKLVYTAGDALFVLTGTKSAPPRVEDAQQGTSTGAVLQFHGDDRAVQVLGAEPGATPGRVRTETHTRR